VASPSRAGSSAREDLADVLVRGCAVSVLFLWRARVLVQHEPGRL